ncbi:MAG: GH25 family lysozyme, partial [Bacillota bacterium]|nr:GH25 family lysozyme [Bacillota bacterium]
MFSRDNRGDDIFSNSTIDTSNPDKIIIREKEAPKKKVRRRVKKGTKEKYLAEKKAAKVKVSAKAKRDDLYKPIDSVPASAPKAAEKYKIPRLSEIEKQRDNFDSDLSGSFRSVSADWKDKKYPDYSELENLSSNPSADGFSKKSVGVMVMQGVAAAILVAIFVVSILATNAYAKNECRENRDKAMSQLVRYGEFASMQMAAEVEDVETPISLEEAKPQIGKSVSLVLSSVEKDLKIKLVDEDDTLVKNVQWGVTITDSDGNSSEENDDDKDGIIHMTDVSAGDYSVELNPSSDLVDYEVPMSAQTVSVKAKIEYKVIANIKEEIKSEKEINAAVEDAAGNQAADVESAAPAMQDTVEWVESTKTLSGEGYVEATPDLSKTASIKKDNIFVALANKLKNAARSKFGNASVAYPVLLVDDKDGTNDGGSGDGNQGGSTGGNDDSTNQDGNTSDNSNQGAGDGNQNQTPTQCDHSSKSYSDITWTENDCTKGGSKTWTCTKTQGCTETGTESVAPNATHEYGADNKCTRCKKQKEVEASITLSGSTTVKVDATTNITATLSPETAKVLSVAVADTGIATASVNGNAVVVKGIKAGSTKLTVKGDNGKEASVTINVTAADQKYSDDAQLYDANKNALYVLENGSYRLAKYKDYRIDPGRKFYRKSEEYKYTGWQTLDGKTYYFNKNHEAITGDHIIGGVKYHFGTDGALSQSSGTLGIDVSKYQPSINWSSVKASGVNYVIIRCGYRGSSTGVLVEDPYFKSHIKGAKAAGLKVGIYFFTTAISEAEAVEEASMVAYLCKGYGIDYPVFMDCESSGRPGYNGMPAGQRTAIIKAFCNTIRSAGYTPGVYANKTWLTSYMNAGELSGYKIWLAQYNAAGPTYSGRYDMWQYT